MGVPPEEELANTGTEGEGGAEAEGVDAVVVTQGDQWPLDKPLPLLFRSSSPLGEDVMDEEAMVAGAALEESVAEIAADDSLMPPVQEFADLNAGAVEEGEEGATHVTDDDTLPPSPPADSNAEAGDGDEEGTTHVADDDTLPPSLPADSNAGAGDEAREGALQIADDDTLPPTPLADSNAGAGDEAKESTTLIADGNTLPPSPPPLPFPPPPFFDAKAAATMLEAKLFAAATRLYDPDNRPVWPLPTKLKRSSRCLPMTSQRVFVRVKDLGGFGTSVAGGVGAPLVRRIVLGREAGPAKVPEKSAISVLVTLVRATDSGAGEDVEESGPASGRTPDEKHAAARDKRHDVTGVTPRSKQEYRLMVKVAPDAASVEVTIVAHVREGVVWALHTLRQASFEPPKAAYADALDPPSGPGTASEWPVDEWRGRLCAPTSLDVADSPATDYRGFLVDSTAVLLPVAFIKHVLEVISSLKFTHLHWHLSDDHAFALTLHVNRQQHQEHQERGAPPIPRYSPGEVASVLRHATAYGVRVVPEIDIPGHAYSWTGHAVHCPRTAQEDVGRFRGHVNVRGRGAWGHPLDVSRASTDAHVIKVIVEVRGMFPGRLLHLGGREVSALCLGESGHTALPMPLTRAATAVAAAWGDPSAVASRVVAATNRRFGKRSHHTPDHPLVVLDTPLPNSTLVDVSRPEPTEETSPEDCSELPTLDYQVTLYPILLTLNPKPLTLNP